jgi:hypothetical protein
MSAQAVKLLICIQQVPISNLSHDNDYPDRILMVFLCLFKQVLGWYLKIGNYNPSISFPADYSPITELG